MTAMIQLTDPNGRTFYASPFEIDLIEPLPFVHGHHERAAVTVAGRTVKCCEAPDEVVRLMQAATSVQQAVTE